MRPAHLLVILSIAVFAIGTANGMAGGRSRDTEKEKARWWSRQKSQPQQQQQRFGVGAGQPRGGVGAGQPRGGVGAGQPRGGVGAGQQRGAAGAVQQYGQAARTNSRNNGQTQQQTPNQPGQAPVPGAKCLTSCRFGQWRCTRCCKGAGFVDGGTCSVKNRKKQCDCIEHKEQEEEEQGEE